MAVETKYVCDKCGHEQETSEQMWKIGISLKHIDTPGRINYTKTVKNKQLWCRGCVEDKLGLLPTAKQSAEAIKPTQITLEDMLREIIQEEIGSV